jgi:hypothetical protein
LASPAGAAAVRALKLAPALPPHLPFPRAPALPTAPSRRAGATGARRTLAWFPDDGSASPADVNMTITITNTSLEFTKLGSFGTALGFGQNLVNSMDTSFFARAPGAKKDNPDVQVAAARGARPARRPAGGTAGRWLQCVQRGGCKAFAAGAARLGPRRPPAVGPWPGQRPVKGSSRLGTASWKLLAIPRPALPPSCQIAKLVDANERNDMYWVGSGFSAAGARFRALIQRCGSGVDGMNWAGAGFGAWHSRGQQALGGLLKR